MIIQKAKSIKLYFIIFLTICSLILSADSIYSLRNGKECSEKGYVDRYEDNNIVVVLSEIQGQEIHMNRNDFPLGDINKAWLTMEKTGMTYAICSIDQQKSKSEKEKTKQLIRELRKGR